MTFQFPKALVLGLAIASVGGGQVFSGDSAVAPSPMVFVSPQVFVNPSIAAAPAPGIAGATAITDSVVRSLNDAALFCGGISETAYAIDCLSERLDNAARQMPETGEFAEARAALLKASRDLNQLAVANAAPNLPRATARSSKPGGASTKRRLVPVDPAKLPEVSLQAADIIATTELILLRSAENSVARQSHYTRIAEAIGTNKLLLRSL
ncbi:MAG: hypothetical protein WCC57_02655 [Paracoccaceae bacterium]